MADTLSYEYVMLLRLDLHSGEAPLHPPPLLGPDMRVLGSMVEDVPALFCRVQEGLN